VCALPNHCARDLMLTGVGWRCVIVSLMMGVELASFQAGGSFARAILVECAISRNSVWNLAGFSVRL
jgi:hypothetical protein